MGLPALDKFLATTTYPQNAYVAFPGMKTLYVRRGKYLTDLEVLPSTIQIANIESRKPGNGAFAHLIDHLKTKHSNLTIVIENVHSDLLASILERWGFDRINLSTGRHFAWRPGHVIEQGRSTKKAGNPLTFLPNVVQ